MKTNFKLKCVLMILLSIVLFQATMTLSFAQTVAQTSVREESTSLENLFQEKVRNILDNLIAPEDYTLVISATIKNDDRKLKEYSDTIERKFMPGLPINDPASFSDANNLLLELKQKVDIQVILTENVPADRDSIVKDILRSKLHLSEESGDSISVVRAARIVPYPKPADQRWFPELSAKMIAFWVLVAMMALTGILLWVQRRKEKAKQQERAEQAFLIEQKRAHEEAKAEEEKKEEPAAPTVDPNVLTDEQKNELEIKMAFEKSEIHKLCTDYGPIVAKAVEEFMIQGHVRESVMVMEAIGWHESKRLFRDLETRSWARIGSTLRTRQVEPSIVEIFEAAHYFHRFALSYVLERTAKEDGNPFGFVFKLNDNQRIDLLNREAPDKIALIGVYCTGPQMTDFLRGLEASKQNEILYHLTRIKQLPETEVKSGVLSYLASLERIKKDPSVFADGPVLAAEFLRSLPAGREEELIQYLFNQHPAEAEKLRRVRVMFQDIPYYPAEFTRKVIENLESDLIQRALTGYDRNFAEEFLQLLPNKKGMMIQNDLLHGDMNLPQSQCAESRREICSIIERHFESQKFKVADYWSDQDQTGGMSGETTREYEDTKKVA
ncbi:MAG: hypothetical protein KGP28_04810 [Bdellovibrionales bacterium]|nr:hypothetical protein [Bdellovibrionales bacterium]